MTTRDDKFTPLERQALARQRAETHPKIAPLKLKDRLHTPGRSACPYSGDPDYPQTNAYDLPFHDGTCPVCLGETLADFLAEIGGNVVDPDATEGP